MKDMNKKGIKDAFGDKPSKGTKASLKKASKKSDKKPAKGKY